MARNAPYYPVTFAADGIKKEFTLGFPFLNQSHLRVIVNGVLKVLGTDYTVTDPTSPKNATIKFVAAPTNGYTIKVYRSTPIAKYIGNPIMGDIDAVQALYRSQEQADSRRSLAFYSNQTDTLAGTAQTIVAPCDGFIEALQTEVCDAAVGTGGAVTVEIDGVAVTGLSISIANSAAIGTVQRDTPTTPQDASTKVLKGQTITVTPAAAFATAGAFKGFVELQPADVA